MTDGRPDRAPAPACPRCGSRAVPILRGYPSPEAFAMAERGEVVLGGCVVTADDPAFACTGFDCGLEFSPASFSPDPFSPASAD